MRVLTFLLIAFILGGATAFSQDEISRKKPRTETTAAKKKAPKKDTQTKKTAKKSIDDMTVDELRKKGLDLYMRDRRKEAYPYIKKGAEKGDPECIYYMGEIYRLGVVGITEIDHDRAIEYYLKAVDLGHSHATYMMGCMYDWIDSDLHDYAKAAQWYAKAADLGEWYAAYKLGEMYEAGKGVTKNQAKAIEWYRRAADLEKAIGGTSSKSRLQELGVPGY